MNSPAIDLVLASELGRYGWPFLRIAALVMVAPVFGAGTVPARFRIGFAVALTVIVAPLLPPAPEADPLTPLGWITAAQEILIGVAMGFIVQMIFDALVIGGQTIAMSMGLGFAMLVDPQRGVSVPVLSQFFIILGLLIFLALDGHLKLLWLLVESFRWLPIGVGMSQDQFWLLVGWGSEMFRGALAVALPGVAALLLVNIAFGVMSRAAPTLNLFAVGFPVALLLGFVVIWLAAPNLGAVIVEMTDRTLQGVRTIFGGG